MTTRGRVWLLGIVGAAVVSRLAWVLYAARDPQGLNDPVLYLGYGESIAAGNGYTHFEGGPTAYYPPGYPLSLGALVWLVRHTPLPDGELPLMAGLLNLLLGVGAVLVVHYIGLRLLDERAALVAAAVMALLPNLVLHASPILTEPLFIFLSTAAIAVAVARPWRDGGLARGQLVAFGALVGLSALVRPVSLMFLPALLVAALVAGAGWRRAALQAAAALAVALVVIAPWTIRNAIVMDAFVPISTNLGDDLCIGHNPHGEGGFLLTDMCEPETADERPKLEVERNRENTGRALEFIVENPGREVELFFLKVHALFNHDHSGLDAAESYGHDRFLPGRARRALQLASNVTFYALLAAALLGSVRFLRGRDPRRLLVALGLGAALLLPLAFFGDARFHVPGVPLLALLAAALVWRGGGERAAPEPAPEAAPPVALSRG